MNLLNIVDKKIKLELMDNSPVDNGQQNQNYQTAQNNYQQYLDSPASPNEPNNKLRKIIILAGVGVLVLIAVVVAAVLLSGGKNNKTNQTVQATACADSNCFESHFKQCTPAEYTYVETGSSVKYLIKNAGDLGCNIEVTYLKAQYVPDEEGKSMACEFDNSVDFQTAARNVFNFPDDYSCSGELAAFFQTSPDSTSTQ